MNTRDTPDTRDTADVQGTRPTRHLTVADVTALATLAFGGRPPEASVARAVTAAPVR